MLLEWGQSTIARGVRKGLWAILLAQGALSVWAGEAPPDPGDTPEALRWSTVMPLPENRYRTVDSWVVPPTILVDWGAVGRIESADLGNWLDRMWSPVGRSWREAGVGEKPHLRFESGGPVGEGYSLSVTPSGVTVRGSGAAGRFYALVTLTQLLPPRARTLDWVAVQGGRLEDKPAFAWRGLMLDSARHFQSVHTLESILELMALHKLNRFHWHLTDDQGWRLEVPGWPRLTEVGAWRTEADGSLYGGFYSAQDVRRVVAFAAQRHITVVPEIDLPGHASAALAAYPELSATGRPRSVPLDWGVADGVLSLGRPAVRRFTADVLATLVDLFPGPYIHWGGDEVYRTPWMQNAESLAWMRSVKATTADQALAAFWTDLASQTLAASKIPIGWDDVTLMKAPQGALPKSTVVQWWDDPQRALAALKEGHPIIASWKETTYLDYPEIDGDGDRAWWMPPLSADTVATQPFWPTGTPASARPLVLGIEATLFTERVTLGQWGRKLFPRLSLVAELAWRGPTSETQGWAQRLNSHRQRLEAWGVGMREPLR